MKKKAARILFQYTPRRVTNAREAREKFCAKRVRGPESRAGLVSSGGGAVNFSTVPVDERT